MFSCLQIKSHVKSNHGRHKTRNTLIFYIFILLNCLFLFIDILWQILVILSRLHKYVCYHKKHKQSSANKVYNLVYENAKKKFNISQHTHNSCNCLLFNRFIDIFYFVLLLLKVLNN